MNSTFPIIHTFKWVEKAAWDNNKKKKSDGYTPPDIILTPLVLAQPLNVVWKRISSNIPSDARGNNIMFL